MKNAIEEFLILSNAILKLGDCVSRVSVSEKLSVAVVILLEKGPMSISSLAEETAKAIGGKVTTIRTQLSIAVKKLIDFGVLMDVGSDRYGSRLVDISPKGIEMLLTILSSGFDFRYFKWEHLVKYFERCLPQYVKHVKLLKILAEEWVKTTIGEVNEKEKSNFIEELAFALTVESSLSRYRDTKTVNIPSILEQMITQILENCIKYQCNFNSIVDRLKKENLSDLLSDIIRRRTETQKTLETILKLLQV